MLLNDAVQKAVESILVKGERVELVPTKDSIKIYVVKRREIKEPASKR